MKKQPIKEPFEAHFMRSIFRLQVLAATGADKIFAAEKKLTISFSQYLVLKCIECSRETDCVPSQISIANMLSISPPAISRHIDNLLMLDYIVCHINPQNKRQHLLALTKKGEKTLEDAKALLTTQSKKLFAGISPSERTILINQLDSVIEKLEAN